jgi:hypothetical protein
VNISLLAANGEGDWTKIIGPIAIAAIYAIISLVNSAAKKQSEKQQGGTVDVKPRYRPLDEKQPEAAPRQIQRPAAQETFGLQETSKREYDLAKERAHRLYLDRMGRIEEYTNRKPLGVSDDVWQQQLDKARQTIKQEYEKAVQQAGEKYQRKVGRPVMVTPPPARKSPKPVQPVTTRNISSDAAASETKKQQQAPEVSVEVEQKSRPSAEIALYKLAFGRDDLEKAVVYSEVLGKPLALRD